MLPDIFQNAMWVLREGSQRNELYFGIKGSSQLKNSGISACKKVVITLLHQTKQVVVAFA